jgi:sugar/nucleoside kinase (ribokinase family)
MRTSVVSSHPQKSSVRQPLKLCIDKQFRYLTPPLHPEVEHLGASFLLRSAAFHMLAQPEDLELQVEDLLSRRSQHGINPSPIIIWEPAPPHCTPLNHDAHVRASKHVDVFSPNHIELASLFEEYDTTSKSLDRANIEEYATRFQEANSVDSTNETKIVVRAGEHGCLVMSKAEGAFWLPPFYDSASPKVLDPTGAGNTFLGAFTIALQHTGSLKESSIYGSVAASFALEQIGMPTLASSSGTEEWNGAEFLARLGEYRRRL